MEAIQQKGFQFLPPAPKVLNKEAIQLHNKREEKWLGKEEIK